MEVSAAPSVLEFVEGAPWQVKAIVGLAAMAAPYVLPRLLAGRSRGGEVTDDEDEDVRELRELRKLLVKTLDRADRAERELAEVRETATRLQGIVDALISRREQPTPPRGTPPPVP